MQALRLREFFGRDRVIQPDAPPGAPELVDEVRPSHQCRRSFPRRPVRWNAIIYHRARIGGSPILIRNISRGGMMLENAFGLIQRDRVRVVLMSGRMFEGEIMWTLAPYCGFKFDRELLEDDSLLIAK